MTDRIDITATVMAQLGPIAAEVSRDLELDGQARETVCRALFDAAGVGVRVGAAEVIGELASRGLVPVPDLYLERLPWLDDDS